VFDIEEDAELLAPKIAGPGPEAAGGVQQLGLFAAHPSAVEPELAGLELDELTPMDALLKLRELQGRLQGRRGAAPGPGADPAQGRATNQRCAKWGIWPLRAVAQLRRESRVPTSGSLAKGQTPPRDRRNPFPCKGQRAVAPPGHPTAGHSGGILTRKRG